MTLAEFRTKAEPILTDFWKELRAYENSYFAKHGHYFQLLNSDTVVDGIDTNLVLRMPTDAKNTMDMLTSYATKAPFKLRVDTFDGPDGQGYKLYIEAVVNGKIYRRNRDSDNVDSGWSLHTPSSLV